MGTCEVAPQIIFNPEYADFINALAGVKKPMDKVSAGQDALVVADVNRWDEVVIETARVPGGNSILTLGNGLGTEQLFARGTLMIGERQTQKSIY